MKNIQLNVTVSIIKTKLFHKAGKALQAYLPLFPSSVSRHTGVLSHAPYLYLTASTTLPEMSHSQPHPPFSPI